MTNLRPSNQEPTAQKGIEPEAAQEDSEDVNGVVLRLTSEVLEVPEVDPEASFYDYYGTSLHAIRICARIYKSLGLEVGPEVVFESDTISELASAVSDLYFSVASRGRFRRHETAHGSAALGD